MGPTGTRTPVARGTGTGAARMGMSELGRQRPGAKGVGLGRLETPNGEQKERPKTVPPVGYTPARGMVPQPSHRPCPVPNTPSQSCHSIRHQHTAPSPGASRPSAECDLHILRPRHTQSPTTSRHPPTSGRCPLSQSIDASDNRQLIRSATKCSIVPPNCFQSDAQTRRDYCPPNPQNRCSTRWHGTRAPSTANRA